MFKLNKDDPMIVLKAVDARIAEKRKSLKFLNDIVMNDVYKSDMHNCLKEAIRIAMMHENDLCSFQYFHKEDMSESLYCSILQYNQVVIGLNELEFFKRELELKIYRGKRI